MGVNGYIRCRYTSPVTGTVSQIFEDVSNSWLTIMKNTKSYTEGHSEPFCFIQDEVKVDKKKIHYCQPLIRNKQKNSNEPYINILDPLLPTPNPIQTLKLKCTMILPDIWGIGYRGRCL